MARPRFSMILFSAFAVAGLFLAALGIYGLMSRVAQLRMNELGIRRTLGASRGQIGMRVLRGAVGPTLAGAGLGVVLAAVATRWVQSLLFGVTPLDPLTFAVTPALLIAVAALAAAIPAILATRVDPMAILRRDD